MLFKQEKIAHFCGIASVAYLYILMSFFFGSNRMAYMGLSQNKLCERVGKKIPTATPWLTDMFLIVVGNNRAL